MKNRKGFTLVELLAVIVILGVIMLIAVPNVVSMIDRNKKRTYIEDARNMVTMAEYMLRSDTSIALPTNSEILVLPLSTINNGDLDIDPEGNEYSTDNSYVAIMKDSNGFDEYWVNLVGINGRENRGVYLTKVTNLESGNSTRFDYVQENMSIPQGVEIARVMCGSTTCKTVRTYYK